MCNQRIRSKKYNVINYFWLKTPNVSDELLFYNIMFHVYRNSMPLAYALFKENIGAFFFCYHAGGKKNTWLINSNNIDFIPI